VGPFHELLDLFEITPEIEIYNAQKYFFLWFIAVMTGVYIKNLSQ
jgi:hypothetical protein